MHPSWCRLQIPNLPTGSGKTSLLDVMACRTMTGEVTGEVYLNGAARTRTMLDTCSAYVRQDDRLLGNLTVRETLMFVAQLKLPTNMKQIEVEDRVSDRGMCTHKRGVYVYCYKIIIR